MVTCILAKPQTWDLPLCCYGNTSLSICLYVHVLNNTGALYIYIITLPTGLRPSGSVIMNLI